MTVREIGFLVWGYYRQRLNSFERRLLKKLLDGITGLGELSDVEIQDYLSEKQIAWIQSLGRRFRLARRNYKA